MRATPYLSQLKEKMKGQLKPSSPTKYRRLQASLWVDIEKMFEMCTNYDASLRPTEISVSPGDRRKSPSSRPWRAGYSDPNKKIFILEDGKIHCVNFSLQAR